MLTAAPTTRRGSSASCRSTEDVSVGEYQRLAHAAIDARGRSPLVVGGTGLYFRAALAALELPPPGPSGARTGRPKYDRLGPEAAHALLAERDPAAAARVHANDRKRVVRALELAEAGASLAPGDDRLWTADTRLPTTIVALDLPLDELDRRIDERTRAMAAARRRRRGARGLGAAARRPPPARSSGSRSSRRCREDEAVAAVAQATRRLARYQRKWLRRMPGVVTLDADSIRGGDRR